MSANEIIELLGIATSLNESAHSKDRRQYQYGRSNLITTQRFAKEFEALDELLRQVGKMIYMRKHYESAKARKVAKNDVRSDANDGSARWDDLCKTLGETLGRYRLFVDYWDKGKSYCGVKVRSDDKGEELQSKNPYMHCADLLKMFEQGFADFNLNEAESIYSNLTCCADCRLHAIETGTRDRRRINKRKQSLVSRIGFGVEGDKAARFDSRCPVHERDAHCDGPESENLE